jgi:hypothetical protein
VPGQGSAVLERTVHALAVERDHRVRRVAQQDRFAALVPVVQVEGAEDADRIAVVIGFELRDQRQCVGEIAGEQGMRIAPLRTVSKPGSPA